MRVLYHHRTQGEEPECVHIVAIAEALRRLGHEVDIIGPGRVAAGQRRARPSQGRAATASIRLSVLGRVKRRTPRMFVELAQIAYNLLSLERLVLALARTRYDFIYERHALFNVAGLLAARLFRLPLILEVNTLYAGAWKKYFGLRMPRLARRLERLDFLGAAAVITVTEVQGMQLAQEGVVPERITVSHNAVDPLLFDPRRFQSAAVKRALGLPPLVAGFVGTMNRWQGVEGFVEVAERVRTECRDVGFLFVGDGERRAMLQSELRRRGLGPAVVFTGRRQHAAIPELIAAMDIGLLLDSNAHGSPMKIFEYWAMGKAVIAPSVPPVVEVLRDGETGLLIRPGDADGMARHILALAEDGALRTRLGEAGRRCVLSAHTWDRNAEAILEALAASRARPVARVSGGAR
jgi:glycosyltransferase involved in cell wall biosynthesis